METTTSTMLTEQLQSLIGGETNHVAMLANASALLFQEIPSINWVGFYLNEDGGLIVGPFQGKPACIRIAFGKGVCGTAASSRQTQRIADVHEFPGHIACDPDSRSELVIPLIKGDQLIGVLDVDSPLLDRFTEADQALLETCAQIIVAQW